MNDYIAELTLDLDCRNTFPTVRAGQYDKGRKILIHITANSQTYSATGCTAIIKGRRQDKTYFSASCTVDSSGNVELTINEEVLAVRGFAYAKIVLSDATRNYSTQIFVIDVDVALEGNVTEVESFSVFNDCLNQLAALFGLNNAQQILAQYLTTNDISLFERRIDPEEIGVVPLNVQTQQPDYTSSQFAQLLNGQVFICSEDPDYHYNGNINELREWNDSLTIWLKISEYNSDLGPIAKQIPLGNNYVPTTTKIAGISLGSDIGAPALRQALSTGKVSTVSSVPTTATVGNGRAGHRELHDPVFHPQLSEIRPSSFNRHSDSSLS